MINVTIKKFTHSSWTIFRNFLKPTKLLLKIFVQDLFYSDTSHFQRFIQNVFDVDFCLNTFWLMSQSYMPNLKQCENCLMVIIFFLEKCETSGVLFAFCCCQNSLLNCVGSQVMWVQWICNCMGTRVGWVKKSRESKF